MNGGTDIVVKDISVVVELGSVLVKAGAEGKRPYVIMLCGNKSPGFVLLRNCRPCGWESVMRAKRINKGE